MIHINNKQIKTFQLINKIRNRLYCCVTCTLYIYMYIIYKYGRRPRVGHPNCKQSPPPLFFVHNACIGVGYVMS